MTLLGQRPGAQLMIALNIFRFPAEETATERLIMIKAFPPFGTTNIIVSTETVCTGKFLFSNK